MRDTGLDGSPLGRKTVAERGDDAAVEVARVWIVAHNLDSFIGDAPEKVDTADQLEQCAILFLSRVQIRAMIRTLRELAAKAS